VSTYENYSDISNSYDSTRAAVGYEIWLGHLLASGRPIDTLRLLDSGCGTGNYSTALAPHVRHITAMDMNKAMLAKAKEKLVDRQLTDRVQILKGSMLGMALRDGEYDAVLFNQVLHHLDPIGDESFFGCEKAISEAARVLKAGGILLINACSRRQLSEGFWYYHLAPDALSSVVRQQVPSARLRKILKKFGFSIMARTVPLEVTMTGRAYHDATGPLSETWRAGDSFWSLVDDIELDAALQTIRQLDAEDGLADFVEAHDAQRPYIGQMTFWVGRKSAA
jgi:ubiquinone/menaquinone biosynthesis C-methylase UbiE